MALRPVLPSVFGEGGVTYQSSPSLHYDNQYAEIGQSISNMGKALGGIANQQFQKQEQLNQEKENLALNKAMSDYDSVVAKGSEGLFQKEGFSAGGISEEFSKMSRDASELPMESLREYSPETMERFRLHVQGRETSYAPRVSRFEHSQIQQATIALKQNLIAGDSKMYAETGDETQLGEMDRNFTEMWEKSGRRLVTPEKLDSYDKAAAAGAFFINGEKLKITEGDESTPGTISKARVADLRKRLEQDQIAFLEGRQDVLDAAHAARLDAYLEKGQITAAVKYLEYNPGENIGRGMSDEALTVLKGKVEKYHSAQIVDEVANILIMEDLASAMMKDTGNRSQSGRHWVNEMDTEVAETRAELNSNVKSASPDDRPQHERTLAIYEQMVNREKAVRNAATSADIDRYHREFLSKGLYSEGRSGELMNAVSRLPDSPVKDKLMITAARRYVVEVKGQAKEAVARKKLLEKGEAEVQKRIAAETEARKRTPEYKALVDTKVAEAKRLYAAGEKWEVDGEFYDLSNYEQREKAVLAAGLPQEAAAQIEAYIQNPRVSYSLLATAVADALNELNEFKPDPEKGRVYFTSSNVTALAPEILTFIDDAAKIDTETKYDTEAGYKKLVKLTRDVMKTQNRVEPGWFNPKRVRLHEYLSEAIDKEGNVLPSERGKTPIRFSEFEKLSMLPEQHREYLGELERIKSLMVGRPWNPEQLPQEKVETSLNSKGYVKENMKGDPVFTPGPVFESKKKAREAAAEQREREESFRVTGSPEERKAKRQQTIDMLNMQHMLQIQGMDIQ